MIKQENIDIRVQRELFKKINSLNKFGRNSSNFVETSKVHKVKGEDVTHTKITNTGGTKFFFGDILDVSEENPINLPGHNNPSKPATTYLVAYINM